MKDLLPVEFLTRMKSALGDDYPMFEAAYLKASVKGLRVNELKIKTEDFLNLGLFLLEPVSWCNSGFYYEEGTPGKHCLHEAGLYYIQEPSAMKVVEELDVKQSDYVLDLCAAPGGKATQIAAKLSHTGFILANEAIPKRAKILAQNFERLGVKSGAVINADPKALEIKFNNYFDKVLVDAPCSGEGMFRKDPLAIQEWSIKSVERCSIRQKEIMTSAVKLVKPGGHLVYSTCTFSKEEDEEIVEWILNTFSEFELVKQEHLWPHKIKGEGHFLAVFTKKGTLEKSNKHKPTYTSNKYHGLLTKWLSDNNIEFKLDKVVAWGNQLNMINDNFPDLQNIKVERLGLPLGRIEKNIFIPEHSFAMVLNPTLSLTNKQVLAYFKGETFNVDNTKDGWVVVGYLGYSLGWGKIVQGTLKNHYPKGLRKNVCL